MSGKTPKSRSKIASGSSQTQKKTLEILPEDRNRRISEAAYFLAERRGFANGRCEEDWYEAEMLLMNNQEEK